MIINLGLPKSGTTTLAEALKSTGMRVADHKIARNQTQNSDLAGSFVAKQLYDGYFDHGDPLHRLREFDALTEINVLKPGLSLWPQTDFGLLQTLRELEPEILFVLTLRPAEDIVDSMLRWNNLGKQRMPRLQIPGLPAGYGTRTLDLIRFVEGHHAFVHAIFGDDPNFLPLHVGDPDARDILSGFIGQTVPWWGRANANPVQTPD